MDLCQQWFALKTSIVFSPGQVDKEEEVFHLLNFPPGPWCTALMQGKFDIFYHAIACSQLNGTCSECQVGGGFTRSSKATLWWPMGLIGQILAMPAVPGEEGDWVG